MGQLVAAGGEFVSVATIQLQLGYSREFVDKTARKLYWEPPKGFVLARTFDVEEADWSYMVNSK